MNTKQKLTLLLGMTLLLLTTMFPPWVYELQDSFSSFKTDAGRSFFLSPPPPKDIPVIDFEMGATDTLEPEINRTQLLLEWILVVAITSGIALMLRDRNRIRYKAEELNESKAR